MADATRAGGAKYAQIVALASHGGGTTAGSVPATIDPALIHRTIDNSFVYGMHVALGVAAAALLCGALLSAVFVGRGTVAGEETVATPFTVEVQAVGVAGDARVGVAEGVGGEGGQIREVLVIADHRADPQRSHS